MRNAGRPDTVLRMPIRSALAVPWLVAALTLAVVAGPAAAAGPSTSLVSLTSTGTKANGASLQAAVSDDGRWVAFTSEAPNLVPPGATQRMNLFLRDRARGTTQQVSLGPGGAQPDQSIQSVAMSGDGRYVAFYASATTLAATPGGLQAFLWDRTTGLTRRVSTNVTPAGVYDLVNDVVISDDGSTVAYTGNDSETSRSDVFVVDVGTGAVKRLGEAAPGVAANGASYAPALSGDGKWLAYSSLASNLATGDDNGYYDIYAENVATGARERVSVRSDEQQANQSSFFPSVDRDGCLVAFGSSATNLVVGADMAGTKMFVRDRCHGETEVASVASNGTVGTGSNGPTISLDGCVVAFRTGAIFSPPPAGSGLALRDRCTGLTSRGDISSGGDAANGTLTGGRLSIGGVRGRYVPFTSQASNLDLGDTDTTLDAFVRDRADVNLPPHAVAGIGQTGSRVSVDAGGSTDADGYALTGAIGFGDGTPEVGSLSALHDYARGGTYTLTITVTDADGATDRVYQAVTVPDPPPPPPGGGDTGPGPGLTPDPGLFVDSAALKLSGVGLSRSRFAVAPAKGRPRAGQGTTLRATLSGGSATLTLAVDRQANGRRSNGRCVSGKKKGARCTLYTSVGSLTKAVKAGAISVAFGGRLSSGALHTGRYRLRVSARAADGRRSAAATIPFTIVARKPTR
jgi:Tol biopolymer transport system component